MISFLLMFIIPRKRKSVRLFFHSSYTDKEKKRTGPLGPILPHLLVQQLCVFDHDSEIISPTAQMISGLCIGFEKLILMLADKVQEFRRDHNLMTPVRVIVMSVDGILQGFESQRCRCEVRTFAEIDSIVRCHDESADQKRVALDDTQRKGCSLGQFRHFYALLAQ